MMYNKNVETYFFDAAHSGITQSNASLGVYYQRELAGQYVLMELFMECTKDQRVATMRFNAKGNPYVIAGLEWVCRTVEGLKLSELPPINYQVVMDVLDIPAAQCATAIGIVETYHGTLKLMNQKFEE